MRLAKILLIACAVALGGISFLHAADSVKEAYYTKVNIWYEEPAKIVITNYHRGAIIPYGAKVNIISKAGDRIQFTVDEQPGITFVLFNVRKHSLVEIKELFEQYFSSNDPRAQGGEFSKFNSLENENIENGTIAQGMNKEAVIAAYGYPPKHKTPTLVSNIWTYWDARSVRKLVTFKNNLVTKTKRLMNMPKAARAGIITCLKG